MNGAHPFILVGESFSGPVALTVAAKSPDNLVGVVLCASFATNPRPLLSLLFFPALFRALFRAGVPNFAIRYFLTGLRSSSDLVNATASVIRSVRPEVLAERLQLIVEADVTPQLANCSVPLIYVAATEDKLVTPKSIAVVKSSRPDLTVVNIEAPHFVAQSQPVEVWKAISRFIDESTQQGF